MFQEVEANPDSLLRHIGDMVAACRKKHVNFRFATDVTRDPLLLAPFDRIVIATGAAYPLGLGPALMKMLERGAGHWPIMSRSAMKPEVRDWFYYRARTATGEQFRKLARPGQTVVVIGDAAKAAKARKPSPARLKRHFSAIKRRHSGARALAREPEIHNHCCGVWIPGSRASLAPRNDGASTGKYR